MKPEVSSIDRYAIIATGGKQYQAIPGRTIAVEKIDGDADQVITFDQVLLRKDGKEKFEFGQPYLENITVKARIVKQMKGPKLIAFKFGRRKKIRTKKGHRQLITVVRIESV